MICEMENGLWPDVLVHEPSSVNEANGIGEAFGEVVTLVQGTDLLIDKYGTQARWSNVGAWESEEQRYCPF